MQQNGKVSMPPRDLLDAQAGPTGWDCFGYDRRVGAGLAGKAEVAGPGGQHPELDRAAARLPLPYPLSPCDGALPWRGADIARLGAGHYVARHLR